MNSSDNDRERTAREAREAQARHPDAHHDARSQAQTGNANTTEQAAQAAARRRDERMQAEESLRATGAVNADVRLAETDAGPKDDPRKAFASNNGILGRPSICGDGPHIEDDERDYFDRHESWPTRGYRPGTDPKEKMRDGQRRASGQAFEAERGCTPREPKFDSNAVRERDAARTENAERARA